MSSLDYSRVEKAIRFLDENAGRHPDLKEVATAVGMSEFHFQRLFKRWAGVSPKRFLRFVTAGRASELLASRPALDASYQLGLSGPSRLHDLMVSVNAVTRGELRSGGAGLEIRWGVHETPFGTCVIGVTGRGICELTFLGDREAEDAVREIGKRWPAAIILEDHAGTAELIGRIFKIGETMGEPLPVLLGGTNFQLQVWRALLEIPVAQVTSYGEIARSIGSPKASRAVGSAIGANRIAFLIPCHRVIRGTSGFGGYRWGLPRKRAMLAWEALKSEIGSPADTAGAEPVAR